MKFRSIMLGTVFGAVAIAATPAMAQFNGTLSGDYGHVSSSGTGGNDWDVNGAAEGSLGMGGLSGQLSGDYNNLSAGHNNGSVDTWNFNGSLFWLGSFGRIGANTGYTTLNANGGGNAHLWNYGGFLEWYAGKWATLGLKGGGLSTNCNGCSNNNGDYVGGEALVYPWHDFSLAGTYDYMSFAGTHETNWAGNAEWLISHEVPISVWGGYEHTDIAHGNANTYFIGLRFYFNGNGAETLRDRQRSGVVGWASQISPIFNF